MTTCCQRPHRCGGGGRNATSSGRTDAELHACSAVRAQCAARMPRKRAAQCAMRQGNKKQIGHHARPRRASTTVPLRTGADTCKTGSGAGKRSGAKADSVRRRSNHAWMEDQAGQRKRANTDVVGGWRVRTSTALCGLQVRRLSAQRVKDSNGTCWV